mmetsp:Transcript_30375/g.65423  ORF Transcript_30375/g.65423 Transcript_30375/m.65423 type:complete len:207 (-) Transcript_30375:721-1341(-)
MVPDQLPQKHHHLGGSRLIGLSQEVHQHEHDALCLVRILASACMKRTDQQSAVLQVALHTLCLIPQSLEGFFLQQGHDVFDVTRTNKRTQADVHHPLANIQRWARKGAEDVHHHAFHDAAMMLLHFLQSIQDNQLDVVVGLLRQQGDESRCCLLDCYWGTGKGHQSRCAVVGHRSRGGSGQVEDDAQQSTFVGSACPADLPDQLQD